MFGQGLHAGVLGAGEDVRVAEFDIVEGVLAEKLHAEAALPIQLALLLVVEGVQLLIDDLQRGAHAHGLAVGFQHALIAAEYADAGADGGLRQIDRGNVGGLRFSSAGRISRWRALMNSRRVQLPAVSARLRQTSTMLEARALVPWETDRDTHSVLIGQVPVMEKPAFMIAESIVSHPVEAVLLPTSSSDSLSLCLNA